MAQVNDNYPKNASQDLSDEQLKEIALQSYKQQEIKQSKFPTEIVELPSKGILYPEGSPLREGTIEMKYMTAREEDILTSANLIRQGVVLDKLFQSMIVSPIKYSDLIVGDKNAIMVAARILGYGKDYEVSVTCPSCGKAESHHIDLTSLTTKEVTTDGIAKMIAPNRFELELPQTKRTVVFQLLSHGLDSEIDKQLDILKKVAKKDSVDTELTTRLKRLIVSVDGIEEQAYINNFVDNELFAMDSRVLRAQIKDVAPDQPLVFNFECPSCGHEEGDLNFPITSQFFWPGA
jgi:predicted RNA-binding Zn-ribbon protein involved in translation (DUF1610 family)